MIRLALAAVVLLLQTASVWAQAPIPLGPREWTIQGEKVEAVFISVDGENVTLHRTSDDEKITVAIADFGEADRALLKEIAKPPELPIDEHKPIGIIEGRIVTIVDGDTFDLRTPTQVVRIRLHGMDAPESRQAFGGQARQVLRQACLKQYARAEVVVIDDFGRAVARVYLTHLKNSGPKDVSLEMLRAGCAWRSEDQTDEAYVAAEQAARGAGRGLWAAENPTPPWVWRERSK